MIIIVLIWLVLIVFSVSTAGAGSIGYRVHLSLNDFQTNSYTLGISHKHYQGVDSENKKVRVEHLSIGFYVFSIEMEFFKLSAQ